jgi:DNA-binding LacI/PurR family transcriptional regulator
MGRPRIVEVARAAGVSRATAARVLSGATNVDPTMAAAVEIAAKELGYEANSAARAARRAPSASSSPSASSTA